MAAFRTARTAVLPRKTQYVPQLGVSIRILILAAVCALLQSNLCLAEPVEATTAGWARKEAERAIPWNQLTLQEQRTLRYIVKNASIYRRLPTRTVECDPEVFTFMAQHPEVVVDMWNFLAISRLKLERKGEEGFYLSDGAGSTGHMKYLHADWNPDARNLAVVYAEGLYEATPLPEPVKAHCLLLLRSASRQQADGTTTVTARLDTFIQLDQKGVEIVAKTIQPLLGKMADHNFVETMKFAGVFSKTAQRNPNGVERLALQLPKTEPAVRDELIAVCKRASERKIAASESAGSEKLAQRVSTEQ